MKKYLIILFLCAQFISYASENSQKYRILVGCPVRQKPAILKEFLDSLKSLDKKSYTLDYFFIDDNNFEESSQLLREFTNNKQSNYSILSSKNDLKYYHDEATHAVKVMKMLGAFKDLMIEKASSENYDFLFLIDSDIVLHPKTIKQLLKAKKDIISNIFWTKWPFSSELLPQVWLSDNYKMYRHEYGEQLSKEEINNRTSNFLNLLKKPGIYEVGGVASCTLISKAALKKDISFKKIKNFTWFMGEDRHFCIRAFALGIFLFVDTHYPAYHIYEEADLAGVEDFKQKCKILNNSNATNSSFQTNLNDLELKSRFVLTTDAQINKVAESSLPDNWWSRPFEYKWAAQFSGPDYIVLDAACGICHPFKWLLGDICAKVWACDIDPQILDHEKIMQETRKQLGEEAYKIRNLNIHQLLKVQLVCSSICNLPDYMPMFDRIFCISTLEHMRFNDRQKALSEFARKLAPNGLVIITVDYPIIKPENLLEMAASVGLIPAGSVELGSPPKDALNGAPYFPRLYIYRCVLKHKK